MNNNAIKTLLAPFESTEFAEKLFRATPRNHDHVLQRLSIRSQVNYLLKSFGHISLQSKPINFSRDLLEARSRTAMNLIDDINGIGKPIKSIVHISANKSISVLLHWWQNEEISLLTLKTRIAHLNWLFSVLRQTKTLSASGFINNYNLKADVVRKRPTQDLPSKSDLLSAFERASKIDRFVAIQLKLIYFLKLTPAQAISLRPINALNSNYLTITQDGTPKPIKFIGPLNSEQIQVVKDAQELARPFKINRIRLPEHSATVARYRFYYVARSVGFCPGILGITPSELSKL
jgi:hypothetical protein